ncbi:MAG: C39 family peptidase, partial [Patescibacteria group bacterium]
MNKTMLVVVMLVSSVVFAQTSVMLEVPAFFSQLDSRWSGDHLGGSKWTIGDSGCVITSIAMAMTIFGIDTDPKRLNEWLSGNGGYNDNGYLNWGQIGTYSKKIGGAVVQITSSGGSFLEEIARGYPVLLKTTVKYRDGTWGDHYILGVGYDDANQYVEDPLKSSGPTTINGANVWMYFIGPVPGGYDNGWHKDGASQAFHDCYNRNGS